MARPKSTTRSVHTAVRLPEELHQRLSEAGRGALAQEIKRRLEASFEWEALDPPTRELMAVVAEMADLIQQDGPRWHSSSYLRAALAEAITGWLQDRVPDEDHTPELPPQPTVWAREGDTPRRAGENLLRLYKSFFSKEGRLARAERREEKIQETLEGLEIMKTMVRDLERLRQSYSDKQKKDAK